MTDTRAHHQYASTSGSDTDAMTAMRLWLDALAPEDRIAALSAMMDGLLRFFARETPTP